MNFLSCFFKKRQLLVLQMTLLLVHHAARLVCLCIVAATNPPCYSNIYYRLRNAHSRQSATEQKDISCSRWWANLKFYPTSQIFCSQILNPMAQIHIPKLSSKSQSQNSRFQSNPNFYPWMPMEIWSNRQFWLEFRRTERDCVSLSIHSRLS